MLGFTSGLAFGGGPGGMKYSSLKALSGWSDGWSAGASVGYGAQSIGASVSHSWNDAGSGTGASFDVGSAGAPGIGVQASWTSTELSNCKRSEEHTSELQSLMRISYAVFCLNKKKTMRLQHSNSQLTPITNYTKKSSIF